MFRFRRVMQGWIALLLVCCVSGLASAQTVYQEDFELPAATTLTDTGWTSTGTAPTQWLRTAATAGINSTRSAVLTDSGSADTSNLLSETFTTISGSNYSVAYSLRGESNPDGKVDLIVGMSTNGSSLVNATSTNVTLPNNANVRNTFTFTATQSSYQIGFFARIQANGSFSILIDDILITGPKVPELNTATASLPLTAFVCLGLAFYDRRRRATMIGCG